MKYIIFLVCLSVNLITIAQEKKDYFILENSIVIWQKVYDTEKSLQSLSDYYKESGLFESIEVSSDKIIGEIKPQSMDVTKAGYTIMGTPVFVTNYDIKGTVVIELKEGKYRVTFKNIIMVLNNTNSMFGEKGSEEKFEEIYLDSKGNFKKPFLKKPKEIYNANFVEIFSINEIKSKEDW